MVGPKGDARTGLLSDYASEETCYGGTDSCMYSIFQSISLENGDASLTSYSEGVELNSAKMSGIPAAIKLVKEADIVVLALGTDKTIEHEGVDRKEITLPGLQGMFAKLVLKENKPTVLVLTNGGQVAFDNLIQEPQAIVEAFSPCSLGAKALGALLFGRENRWGRLPVTLYGAGVTRELDPANYDFTKPPGRGYRYYTGQPLFRFGDGLTYTSFDLSCEAPSCSSFDGDCSSPYGDYSCTIRNTGNMTGDEVVFVFHQPTKEIRAVADHVLPLKHLVGFQRVTVEKGKLATVQFEVNEDMFQLSAKNGSTVIYKGRHVIEFSTSTSTGVFFNVSL